MFKPNIFLKKNMILGINSKNIICPKPQRKLLYNAHVSSFFCNKAQNVEIPSKKNIIKPVRVRFAPSPTGLLHLGGLRTALFNYLFSNHNNGKFILRLEDTDQSRLVQGASEAIFSELRWAGLTYDEGPDIGGEYGPYIQSQRLEIYQKYTNSLLAKGLAYKCFCSADRVDNLRLSQKRLGQPTMYDGYCRNIPKSEALELSASGMPYVVRFRASNLTETEVHDELRGNIIIKHPGLEDFVLIKSDKFPTYHLASVVDDHLMRISHVFRGEEWLMSLPKHLALYNAFGWSPPAFVHLTLLHNPDGTKLSKRVGDVHVQAYRERGYLAKSLNNFVALLGWAPKDSTLEVMDNQQLINEFDIKHLNVSSPKVFPEKLRWFNQQHLIRLIADSASRQHLVNELIPLFMKAYGPNLTTRDSYLFEPPYIETILLSMKERIFTLNELVNAVPYFFKLPQYEALLNDPKSTLSKYISSPDGFYVFSTVAKHWVEFTQSNPHLEFPPLIDSIVDVANHKKIHKNAVHKSLRMTLTATQMGPPINDVLRILGHSRIRERLAFLLKLTQNIKLN